MGRGLKKLKIIFTVFKKVRKSKDFYSENKKQITSGSQKVLKKLGSVQKKSRKILIS